VESLTTAVPRNRRREIRGLDLLFFHLQGRCVLQAGERYEPSAPRRPATVRITRFWSAARPSHKTFGNEQKPPPERSYAPELTPSKQSGFRRSARPGIGPVRDPAFQDSRSPSGVILSRSFFEQVHDDRMASLAMTTESVLTFDWAATDLSSLKGRSMTTQDRLSFSRVTTPVASAWGGW